MNVTCQVNAQNYKLWTALTSKPTQVTLFDFDQTLHTFRAIKNNRYVFLYIDDNSVLRVETIL